MCVVNNLGGNMPGGPETGPGDPTINRLRREAQTFGGRSADSERIRQEDAVIELRKKAQSGERVVGDQEEPADSEQVPDAA